MRLWCWCIEILVWNWRVLPSFDVSLFRNGYLLSLQTHWKEHQARRYGSAMAQSKHLLPSFVIFSLFRANGEILWFSSEKRMTTRKDDCDERCVYSSTSRIETFIWKKKNMLNERKTLVQCRAVTKWLRDDERTSVHATLRTATLSVVRQAHRSRVEGQ